MPTQTINDMSVTWNSGGTTFAGIKLDVTNTASAAASALCLFQLGSADVFSLGRDGALTMTTAAADAIAIGPNGVTNPGFLIDASTASAATGFKITPNAAASGLALAAISSGTNENVTIDAKGSGTVTINGTATGAVAIGAAASVAGALTASAALIGSVQSLSGAGAVNVTTLTTAFTSTGAGNALTLADGTAGQVKTIVHVVDGGSGVLTPTSFGNGTTVTLAAAGDAVTLVFAASNWWIVGSQGSPVIA